MIDLNEALERALSGRWAEAHEPNARCWYARCGRKLRKGISPEDELREIRSALKG